MRLFRCLPLLAQLTVTPRGMPAVHQVVELVRLPDDRGHRRTAATRRTALDNRLCLASAL